MIVSVHIADVGWRRAPRLLLRRPDKTPSPGLTYAEPVTTAPLSTGLLPRPKPGRVGLIAAWQDDEALDRFLRDHPTAQHLAGGWHVRLEPLRVFGSWTGMPDLPSRELPVDDDEPVVVLTLGRLRLNRARPFLRSAAAAEAAAVGDDAMIASTALARPPHLVSTFSIWRSAAAMRRYAFGKSGAHQAAVKADRRRPFHHESAFIRFRPYASQGSWDGRDPLATA
ncbi:MAG TPA: hypothetical protein VF729_02990 [Solirubrobacterales bacterium]